MVQEVVECNKITFLHKQDFQIEVKITSNVSSTCQIYVVLFRIDGIGSSGMK